jgi:hypothetical protein
MIDTKELAAKVAEDTELREAAWVFVCGLQMAKNEAMVNATENSFVDRVKFLISKNKITMTKELMNKEIDNDWEEHG